MTVDLNRLFQYVNQPLPMDRDSRVYIRQGGAIDQESEIGRLRAFFTNARAVENRESVDAFIEGIQANVSFGQVAGGTVEWLGQLRQSGAPLTAGHVREAQDRLHAALLDRHMQAAEQHEAEGRIPPGQRMQFATFCAGRGIPAQPPGEALKAYNAARMEAEIAAMFREMGRQGGIRGMPEACARLVAEHPVFEERIAQLYANEPFPTFEEARQALEKAVCHIVDALDQYSEYSNPVNIIKNFSTPAGRAKLDFVVRALEMGVVDIEEASGFFSGLGWSSIDTYPSKLVDCRYRADASDLMRTKLEDRGLPGEWAPYLAHRPEVRDVLLAHLLEQGIPPELPDSGRMRALLGEMTTMDDLLDRYAGLLEECRQIAKDPPPALRGGDGGDSPLMSPLSEKRMGQLINGMLGAEFLMDSVRGEDFDPSAFLRALSAMRANVATGLSGGPDFSNGIHDLMAIELARWGGVSPEERVKLAEQALHRWAPLIHGLESVYADAAGKKNETPADEAFCQELRNTINLLTYSLQGMVRGLSDADLARLGLERIPMEKGGWRVDVEPLLAARTPLDRLPPGVREFIVEQGRELPPPAEPKPGVPTNRAVNDHLNKAHADRIRDETADEFFRAPGADGHPLMFYTALDGVDGLPGDFNPGDMDTAALRHAYDLAVRDHVAKGRLLDADAARTLALGVVQNALETILEETRDLPDTRAALLKYPVSPEALSFVMSSVRDGIEALTLPAADRATMGRSLQQVASGLSDLFTNSNMPKPGNFAALQAVFLGAFAESLSRTEAEALLTRLIGPDGNELARDFATFLALPGISGSHKKSFAAALATLRALRGALGARVGREVPALQAAPRGHPSEITAGLWEHTLGGTVFQTIGQTRPSLNARQWDIVARLIERSDQQLADPRSTGSMAPLVMRMALCGAAGPLADAFREAEPNEPTPEAVWKAVMGQKPPRSLKADRLFPMMVQSMLQQARKLGGPDLRMDSLMMALRLVSFPKLLEINQGAALAVGDLRLDPCLSSLAAYTPRNAYGLTIDFGRAGERGAFTFHLPDGEQVFRPHHIPDRENNPANKEFVRIIETARGLCQGNEPQALRLLQCCSQASLVVLKMLSAAFPGVPPMDEHGHFTLEARRRPNGDIEVVRESMPDAPQDVHLVYVIKPDGEVEVEAFDVRLRK